MSKISWEELIQDYSDGATITDLSRKYDCSRQAIYKRFHQYGIQQANRQQRTMLGQIAIDDRFTRMHVAYEALNNIQNAVEDCSVNLKRTQFQMQALFRHMQDLKETFTDIHETHLSTTIKELRNELRQGHKQIIEQVENGYTDAERTSR